MNRNVESHFAYNPTNIDIQRSRFDRSFGVKTTFNAGQLIPIFCEEVLPGDTYEIDTSFVARMATPIFPVMDNAYIDYYFFFVPNRLTWEHWQEFCGENKSTYWTQEVEYSVPQVTSPAPSEEYPDDSGWNKGSIADFYGLPTGVLGLSVNALPFRGYTLIWNEWFRDQNTMSPAYMLTDDVTQDGLCFHSDDITAGTVTNYNSAFYGGTPLPVSKYHDYFTSCLPAPQKGPAVTIPIGINDAFVDVSDTPHANYGKMSGLSNLLTFNVPSGFMPDSENQQFHSLGISGSGFARNYLAGDSTDTSASVDSKRVTPDNLIVNFDISASTINEMRQAFAVQRLLEKDARGGSRYIEILKSHFGVTSPDARLQRPEYLGGARVPINVDQVLQTSSSDEVSPQGNAAAYSLTQDVRSSFTHSFVEHGFIHCLACVRTDHTYQQGVNRMWSRTRRFDYYWPSLANVGEMAVLRKELVAEGSSVTDDMVFGYQEAWADYRYRPSVVNGAFRSTYAQPLDSWHYADYFDDQPTLNSDFISETLSNIDRTLAVQSSTEDQFISDWHFKMQVVRPMPLYSIPGLLDHN